MSHNILVSKPSEKCYLLHNSMNWTVIYVRCMLLNHNTELENIPPLLAVQYNDLIWNDSPSFPKDAVYRRLAFSRKHLKLLFKAESRRKAVTEGASNII